ncbi:MBL fold metallo-hydrolase [Ornithinimicrobium cerasi]|uniref:L-ascorbate metabolism protein UlaG, beta-lactamase superfamily n=1 Tax=Ornithinimicrobium cerasi TaxID=2248773 RepID=A0A285VLA7_9MICO|nr:MBL fold metallo-hydrolase [Ornithinimicrobium cerasi]SOC54862.1 L-ascorbate metabolism protein UlaG, beta-lactamase superfamily [Ornithinimicrobium cerasi]
MQLTSLGHACLLVESADQRVLVDPGNFSDVGAQRDLTAVVVTHQHPDHCDLEQLPALLRTNPRARVLVEPQTAEVLAREGLADRAERMSTGQVLELGHLRVTPVGEVHAEIHPYLDRIGNVGVVLRSEGEPSVYHPGDALDGEPGDVDVLCVPVSAPWGKVSETIEFVRRIAPTRGVVPIHDGLLVDAGRAIYLKHIEAYGADGGVDLFDLRDAGPTVL